MNLKERVAHKLGLNPNLCSRFDIKSISHCLSVIPEHRGTRGVNVFVDHKQLIHFLYDDGLVKNAVRPDTHIRNLGAGEMDHILHGQTVADAIETIGRKPKLVIMVESGHKVVRHYSTGHYKMTVYIDNLID